MLSRAKIVKWTITEETPQIFISLGTVSGEQSIGRLSCKIHLWHIKTPALSASLLSSFQHYSAILIVRECERTSGKIPQVHLTKFYNLFPGTIISLVGDLPGLTESTDCLLSCLGFSREWSDNCGADHLDFSSTLKHLTNTTIHTHSFIKQCILCHWVNWEYYYQE